MTMFIVKYLILHVVREHLPHSGLGRQQGVFHLTPDINILYNAG